MPLVRNRPAVAGTTFFDLPTVRVALVVALILWIPVAHRFSIVVDVHSPFLDHPYLRATVIGPLDAVFLLLALTSLPLVFRRAAYRGRPIGLIGALTLTAVTLILVIVGGPTPEGVARIVRFAGITGVIATVGQMSPVLLRNAVVWPLAGSAAVQALVALAQTFVWHSGRESGITVRFDHSWTQGYGTIGGPYALATLLVVSIAIVLAAGAFKRLHPLMWVSVMLASAAVATTFGRSGAMAVCAIACMYAIAWIVKRKTDYLTSSIATLLPMTFGIAIAWRGWSVRAAEAVAGEQWGREALLRRAFEIIKANPIFGVGPGKYSPTLARIGLTDVDITIVHNVPALVAAEYGVPLGIMFTVWLGVLGLAALFTSVRAAGVFVAIVPYLLLDHSPILYGYGIALFGLWLATLDYLWQHRAGTAPREETPVGEAAPATA